jgi:hypothetical protein
MLFCPQNKICFEKNGSKGDIKEMKIFLLISGQASPGDTKRPVTKGIK